jgi:hypothetical protein
MEEEEEPRKLGHRINWLQNSPVGCNFDGSTSQNTDEGSGSETEKRKFPDVSMSEFSCRT